MSGPLGWIVLGVGLSTTVIYALMKIKATAESLEKAQKQRKEVENIVEGNLLESKKLLAGEECEHINLGVDIEVLLVLDCQIHE